jgi:pre-mRNA-splicing helicase BRR2
LVSLLVKNRHKIYYCTILGQAQTAEERKRIADDMKNNDIAENILEAI